MNAQLEILIDILEQAFRKKSWHGTNLFGAVRGLTPVQASWRPASNRHNIWEHIVHAAYWKYTVTRRITSASRGSFPLKGSNWFVRPEVKSVLSFKQDLALLKQCHQDLVDSVRDLSPNRLSEVPAGSRFTFAGLITGVAAHDLYHAGQIQLLKRLQNG